MTAGKRPRLMMRRTVSVASLGGAGSDHLSDPNPNQQQPHQQPVHQVIGFAPKAFSEGNKFLLQDPTTPMVFGEPSCPFSPGSSRSGKPFSGLSLLSDSPRDGVDNTKVGLGIVAALENDKEFIGSPPVNSTPVFRSAALTPAPAPAPAPVAPVAPLVVVVPAMNLTNGPRYIPPPDLINFTSITRSRPPEPGFCIDQNKLDKCLLRPSFTTLGFLKSCFLCKRDISHGHDIYMYRGDRAFCSAECRHQQILNDERAERKCSSAALKAAAVAAAANHQHNHHHHHHHQQQASRVVHHQRSSKVSTAPATTAAAA